MVTASWGSKCRTKESSVEVSDGQVTLETRNTSLMASKPGAVLGSKHQIEFVKNKAIEPDKNK